MKAAVKNYFIRHVQNCLAALGNMTRQPLSSGLTITVVGIALAMPSGLNVMVRNGQAVAGGWENVRDFSVYLHPDTSQDEAAGLRDELQAFDLIDSARLITADQALEEFQQDPGFGEVIAALGDNPLPHTIVLRPTAEASPQSLEELGIKLQDRKSVDLVKLDTEWVARLNALLDLLSRTIWIAGVMLVGAVIVIIGNTIRLDIQNRRAEIEVSKLLGANDAFVRRPFLYTGFWYGILGGCFALVLLAISLWLLSEPVYRLISLYGSGFQPLGINSETTAAVLAGGLLAGLGGAWSAVARHLSAIQPRV